MRLASFPRFLHPYSRQVPLIFMYISYTIKNAVNKLNFLLASFCIKSTFPPAPVAIDTQVQTVSWNSWLKPRNNQSSADLLQFRSISREVYNVHGLSVIQSEPTFYGFFQARHINTGYKDISYTNLETYFNKASILFRVYTVCAYPLLRYVRGEPPLSHQPRNPPTPPPPKPCWMTPSPSLQCLATSFFLNF
jgi:hypothetical protein